MYAFERFSERAKKVLTLAQDEAERHNHSYIGTEHLLLALLSEGEGLAAVALGNLHVEIAEVRKEIRSVLGRNERIIVRQRVPTSRVKKVIEISFEEAQRMGHNYVGTEHLLLGLLIEAGGIAAHVLGDMGVTVEAARAEIDRLLHESREVTPLEPGGPVRPPGAGALLGREVLQVIRYARVLAEVEKAPSVTLDHLERVLASPEVRSLLELATRVAEHQGALEAALEAREFEEAARIRNVVKEGRDELERAERAWRRSLGRSRRRRRPPS